MENKGRSRHTEQARTQKFPEGGPKFFHGDSSRRFSPNLELFMIQYALG